MKVRTRAADGMQVPDCGHPVQGGRVVVRRGRRWVCAACSLPGGTAGAQARSCPACGLLMDIGSRIALRPDGRWCHQECCGAPVLALVSVSGAHAW